MKNREKSIDWQIKQWEVQNELNLKNQPQTSAARPVITISRAPGARGQEIAKALAQASGFHLFDRELVEAIADDLGVQTKIIESLDESARPELEAWFDGILRGRIIDSSDYLKTLSKLLGAISHGGNAIIVGRGANFILGPTGGFHVRVTGSLDRRIDRIVELKKLSSKHAREIIEEVQARRRIFIQRSFGANIENPESYDLILNTDFLEINDAVDIILLEYGKKNKHLVRV